MFSNLYAHQHVNDIVEHSTKHPNNIMLWIMSFHIDQMDEQETIHKHNY